MRAADLIVVDEGTELRVVTQPDHAHFAAELVSLWCTHGLPDHRLLKLADTLSLKVCRRGESHIGCLGVRGGLESESLVLEPFPLAGATTFRIP
jgi:hypothetical protein